MVSISKASTMITILNLRSVSSNPISTSSDTSSLQVNEVPEEGNPSITGFKQEATPVEGNPIINQTYNKSTLMLRNEQLVNDSLQKVLEKNNQHIENCNSTMFVFENLRLQPSLYVVNKLCSSEEYVEKLHVFFKYLLLNDNEFQKTMDSIFVFSDSYTLCNLMFNISNTKEDTLLREKLSEKLKTFVEKSVVNIAPEFFTELKTLAMDFLTLHFEKLASLRQTPRDYDEEKFFNLLKLVICELGKLKVDILNLLSPLSDKILCSYEKTLFNQALTTALNLSCDLNNSDFIKSYKSLVFSATHELQNALKSLRMLSETKDSDLFEQSFKDFINAIKKFYILPEVFELASKYIPGVSKPTVNAPMPTPEKSVQA